MKKSIFTLILALVISAMSFAQLTGTKSIPGDYPSVQAAIAALNTSGVGPGGVIFNLGLDYTETFTSPTAGHITTATASATSPIVFQKFPLGSNPLITAAEGTSSTMDAIIAFTGCDYVTFDGISLQDNPANTTPTTNMEWGYAILKASATDGSQNITIKNSVITLNKTYTATVGIYSNNHTPAAVTQRSFTRAHTPASTGRKPSSAKISWAGPLCR